MISMNANTVATKAAEQRQLDVAKAAFFAKGGKANRISPDQYDHTRVAHPAMRHRVTRGQPKTGNVLEDGA